MFFFFNDTATTEIYTLSLHDALPILYVSLLLNRIGLPLSLGVTALIIAIQYIVCRRQIRREQTNQQLAQLGAAPPTTHQQANLPASAYPRQIVGPGHVGITRAPAYSTAADYGMPPSYEEAMAQQPK